MFSFWLFVCFFAYVRVFILYSGLATFFCAIHLYCFYFQQYASELFQHVRFHRLSAEYLMDHVAKEDFVRNCRKCRYKMVSLLLSNIHCYLILQLTNVLECLCFSNCNESKFCCWDRSEIVGEVKFTSVNSYKQLRDDPLVPVQIKSIWVLPSPLGYPSVDVVCYLTEPGN